MGLGQVFTKIRENKKISRYRAAKEMRISYSFLRDIEIGEKVPSVATLFQIAKYYDTKLYKVFKELDA